jgi:ATP-binding cassette subfamily B protein
MDNKSILLRIASYLKSYKAKLTVAICSLITVAACLLTLGNAIRRFMDDGAGSYNNFAHIVIIIITFGIASFIRSYFINTIAESVASDVTKDAYMSIMNLSIAHLDKEGHSPIASSIIRNSENINKIVTDLTSFGLRNMITSIGGFIMMVITCKKLSMMVFGGIIILAIYLKVLSRKLKTFAREVEQSKATLSSLIFETLANLRISRAFNTERNVGEHFIKMHNKTNSTNMIRLRERSKFFSIAITSILLIIVFVIGYGNYEVARGNLTPGVLAAFMFYAFLSAMSFGGMIEMFSDVQKHLAGAEIILTLAATNSNNINNDQTFSIKNTGSITLENITFAYPTRPDINVLQDFNMQIDLGKYTAITGESGKGKSTILQILIGLYKPNSGVIKINSTAYDCIDAYHWGKKLAYVAQDPMLFTGSILENITFFATNYDIDNLKLKQYIDSLSLGVDTDVGNMATQMSGGQKQRIAIARALISNPDILLLDEATSNLDYETEDIVLSVIKEYMNNKTVISVAHRKSAVMTADTIIEL